MRKWYVLGMVGLLSLVLAGCSSTSEPEIITRDIVSRGGADDGFIGLDSLGYYTVFSSDAPHRIEVSDDPADSRRGFVSFSISSIPAGASIRSATVFLPVFRATPVAGVRAVTVFVDMVSFHSLNTLTTQGQMASVFSATPISFGPNLSVLPGDAGFDVTFDAITALNQARTIGFSTLQFRLVGLNGDVIFDDLPSDTAWMPMLRVEYF
jgi:hypothetical protein